MKKTLIAMIAVSLLLPAAARAQQAVPYSTMQQPAAVPDVNPDPAAATAPAPAAAAAPQGGHTPISEDMAKAYYANCAAKSDPHISADSMKAMCSCTSAAMVRSMSVEDIQTMAQNTQAGRDMLNHMLLDVYAPCMNFPLQDLVEGQCLQDPKTASLPAGIDRKQICHCMAAKTGTWFTTNGRDLMTQVLKSNPNITDPVDPVMEDPSFQKASYDNLTACVTGGGAP